MIVDTGHRADFEHRGDALVVYLMTVEPMASFVYANSPSWLTGRADRRRRGSGY